MKRIISALMLLALCIGMSIYGSFLAEKKTQILINLLNETEYSLNADNSEKALESLKKLEGEWEKASKFFSSVSETALIDELDVSLSSIEKHISSDMKEDALVVIEQCRLGLGIITRRQKLSIENIL